MFSLVLMSTSCCKEDDDPIDNPTVSVYAGYLQNDLSVTVASDVEDEYYGVGQWEFDLVDKGTAKRYDVSTGSPELNATYGSWKVENNQLVLNDNGSTKTYTVITAPTETIREMVLEYVTSTTTFRYYLSEK